MIAISDAPQRLAAIDPSVSFIVQAPAGSGKTELLTQRFLALLATVEKPEEILAITFTRKAAAEMRSRLLEALERARGPRPEADHAGRTWDLARAVLDRDLERGWRLQENPGRLGIQTIDSFNASLVRRMPWITRLGAVPRISDDPAILYRRAAERTLARLAGSGREGDAIAHLLRHLDNRLDHLRDLMAGLLGRRDQWMRHLAGRAGEQRRRLLEDSLRRLVEAELRAASGAIPHAIRADLVELAPFAAANLLADGKDGPVVRLRDLEAFPGADAEELPLWKGLAELLLTTEGGLRKAVDKRCGFPADKTEPCVSMKRRMKEVLDWLRDDAQVPVLLGRIRELPPVAYTDEQWRVLSALLDLLPLATAELWLAFREEGTADFAEIALRAQQALQDDGNPTELLLRLDSALRHILIDEFQDTSHLQYALVERLIDGWTPGDGRTLFLVGDPMQSIYRFREAEVGLFLRARARGIGGLALQGLSLSANFRSQSGIVDWVNGAFEEIFPPDEDAARGAVPLARAEAVHSLLEGSAVSVHPRVDRDDEREAQQVVDLVRQARGDFPGEKVAILVRSRTHLAAILPALRAAGISYQAQDIDLLAERPVARDLVSLTRAILHPHDRLSWLSVLRAPWCGLTLSDLHALCGGRAEAIADLVADPDTLGRLSDDGRQRAQRVIAIVTDFAARRGRVGLRALVEGAWLALGGPVLLDGAAMEDAEQVLSLLEGFDEGGDLADLEALDSALLRLYAAPDAKADGGVQVMTVHKAKGLEFDTVIVPGLGRKPRRGDQPLLRWLDHPELGLLLGPIHPKDGAGRDPLYDALGRIEKEKDDLEVRRLLYVAATRAKKRLHLLGHAARNAQGECRPEAGSFLQILWNQVEGLFAALPAEDGGEPEAVPAAPPLLRRLPAGWSPPELRAAPLTHLPQPLNPSELGREDARQLLFSGWEAETARHIGTVAHRYLERIADEGLELWPPERLRKCELPIRRRLGQLGVPLDEMESAAEKVSRALGNVLKSERGRWLLRRRSQAQCEYPLCGVAKGRIVHAVLDRTFVEDGVRWIVDYKMSAPLKAQRTALFLDAEAERYAPQLQLYAALFRALEPGREVKTALYFPLVDGWREVEDES